MPNRALQQTDKIRNQTLADLKRIYAKEWREISADVERLAEEMYLDAERSTQAERLKYADKSNSREKLSSLIVAAAVLANTKAIKRINSGMGRIYHINANDVSSYVLTRTGVDLGAKGVNVQSLLGKYTKRRYNNATDSKYVKREVMKEIADMLKKGEGTKKIAQRLEKVYGFNRTSAFRTTRTETTRFQSGGRYETMMEAAKRGFVFKKIWVHGHYVKEPRDWHVDMSGESQDLDKPFSNGLMYPCEDGAPAEETINCHCHLDEELIGWSGNQQTVANHGESDIIKLPDIQIGRSVGAMARNYDIDLPDGGIVHLTEGSKISNITVIAGKGRDRQIDIVDILVDKYGGTASEWQKVKGLGYVDYAGESLKAELHWYQEPTAGKVEFKIKPQRGGEYFIYED